MSLDEDKIIGIVGGMGPQSGLYLYNTILRLSNAETDQQHKSVILMSFPKYIEDRTMFLDGHIKINPAFSIANIINKLEAVGAKVIGIACNTAHSPEIYNVIVEELKRKRSKIELINMPFETCMHIKKNYPNVRKVGLMSTNGTYKSGVYKNLLHSFGFEVITPQLKFQNDIIHRIIYDPAFGIKSKTGSISKEIFSLLDKALRFFETENAEAIILGCTEFSLIPKANMGRSMHIIDSTEALAIALIRCSES